MTLLILYGFLAISISFLCSLAEACLLSLPLSYVESMIERKMRMGAVLREMKNNIDRPLAAILTLNTIAHTAGAAGVGAQATLVFSSSAVGIASAVMTFLILVFSEIIPKTLGAVHAKALAPVIALIIRGMIILSLPLIIPLEWINRMIGYQRQENPISREELLAFIRLSRASGAVDQQEFKIASNLVVLSQRKLTDVLTPRTVVFSLHQDMTVQETLENHSPLRFARIPIYDENPEVVLGYVSRTAIYEAYYNGEKDKQLRDLVIPIPLLPEMAEVGNTLRDFIRNRQQIAVVLDEYGGMEGIVTLEDLLETLLGEEIVDETDDVEDMQELARKIHRSRFADKKLPPESNHEERP